MTLKKKNCVQKQLKKKLLQINQNALLVFCGKIAIFVSPYMF